MGEERYEGQGQRAVPGPGLLVVREDQPFNMKGSPAEMTEKGVGEVRQVVFSAVL